MSTMLVSGSEEDMLMIPVKRKGAAACDDGAGEKASGVARRVIVGRTRAREKARTEAESMVKTAKVVQMGKAFIREWTARGL